MAQGYHTGKSGRYPGPGDPLNLLVCGGLFGPLAFLPMLEIGSDKWVVESFRGASPVPAAADSTLTTTNSGTIGMAAGGLALVSGAANTNNTTFQKLRAFTPAAGKRAFYAVRMQFSTSVAVGKGYVGFWSTQADPSGTTPVDGAYFAKSTAGTGVITAVTEAASTPTTSGTLGTAVAATDFIVGCLLSCSSSSAGTASFFYRAVGAGWGSPTQQTTNFPANAIRFGANITATSAAAQTMTISDYIWGFEK